MKSLGMSLAAMGHEVREAENGLAALELLAQNADDPPCLLFVDLRMPVLDGWDLDRKSAGATRDGGASPSSYSRPRSSRAHRGPYSPQAHSGQNLRRSSNSRQFTNIVACTDIPGAPTAVSADAGSLVPYSRGPQGIEK